MDLAASLPWTIFKKKFRWFFWTNELFSLGQEMFQRTGSFPLSFKYLFVCEKTLHPKNLVALRGLGCAAFKTKCFLVSIDFPLFWANFPQRMKTTPFFCWLMILIISSVNFCQPIFSWLFGFPDSTVNVAFNNKTPCFAQASRLPCFGVTKPSISVVNSL